MTFYKNSGEFEHGRLLLQADQPQIPISSFCENKDYQRLEPFTQPCYDRTTAEGDIHRANHPDSPKLLCDSDPNAYCCEGKQYSLRCHAEICGCYDPAKICQDRTRATCQPDAVCIACGDAGTTCDCTPSHTPTPVTPSPTQDHPYTACKVRSQGAVSRDYPTCVTRQAIGLGLGVCTIGQYEKLCCDGVDYESKCEAIQCGCYLPDDICLDADGCDDSNKLCLPGTCASQTQHQHQVSTPPNPAGSITDYCQSHGLGRITGASIDDEAECQRRLVDYGLGGSFACPGYGGDGFCCDGTHYATVCDVMLCGCYGLDKICYDKLSLADCDDDDICLPGPCPNVVIQPPLPNPITPAPILVPPHIHNQLILTLTDPLLINYCKNNNLVANLVPVTFINNQPTYSYPLECQRRIDVFGAGPDDCHEDLAQGWCCNERDFFSNLCYVFLCGCYEANHICLPDPGNSNADCDDDAVCRPGPCPNPFVQPPLVPPHIQPTIIGNIQDYCKVHGYQKIASTQPNVETLCQARIIDSGLQNELFCPGVGGDGFCCEGQHYSTVCSAVLCGCYELDKMCYDTTSIADCNDDAICIPGPCPNVVIQPPLPKPVTPSPILIPPHIHNQLIITLTDPLLINYCKNNNLVANLVPVTFINNQATYSYSVECQRRIDAFGAGAGDCHEDLADGWCCNERDFFSNLCYVFLCGCYEASHICLPDAGNSNADCEDDAVCRPGPCPNPFVQPPLIPQPNSPSPILVPPHIQHPITISIQDYCKLRNFDKIAGTQPNAATLCQERIIDSGLQNELFCPGVGGDGFCCEGQHYSTICTAMLCGCYELDKICSVTTSIADCDDDAVCIPGPCPNIVIQPPLPKPVTPSPILVPPHIHNQLMITLTNPLLINYCKDNNLVADVTPGPSIIPHQPTYSFECRHRIFSFADGGGNCDGNFAEGWCCNDRDFFADLCLVLLCGCYEASHICLPDADCDDDAVCKPGPCPNGVIQPSLPKPITPSPILVPPHVQQTTVITVNIQDYCKTGNYERIPSTEPNAATLCQARIIDSGLRSSLFCPGVGGDGYCCEGQHYATVCNAILCGCYELDKICYTTTSIADCDDDAVCIPGPCPNIVIQPPLPKPITPSPILVPPHIQPVFPDSLLINYCKNNNLVANVVPVTIIRNTPTYTYSLECQRRITAFGAGPSDCHEDLVEGWCCNDRDFFSNLCYVFICGCYEANDICFLNAGQSIADCDDDAVCRPGPCPNPLVQPPLIQPPNSPSPILVPPHIQPSLIDPFLINYCTTNNLVPDLLPPLPNISPQSAFQITPGCLQRQTAFGAGPGDCHENLALAGGWCCNQRDFFPDLCFLFLCGCYELEDVCLGTTAIADCDDDDVCLPGPCPIPAIQPPIVVPPNICIPVASNTITCAQRYDSNDGCGYSEPLCCNINGLITEYEDICQVEACGCLSEISDVLTYCKPGTCVPPLPFTYIPLPQGQITCAPFGSNTEECKERYDSNDGCGYSDPYCCNFNGLITEYENICQAEACGCFVDLTALSQYCTPGICIPEIGQIPHSFFTYIPLPQGQIICVPAISNTPECNQRYDSNDGCGFADPYCCNFNGLITEYESICQAEACGCFADLAALYDHCTPGRCVPSIGQVPYPFFTYIPLPQGQIICAPAISNTPECDERYTDNDGCGSSDPYCCDFNGLITEYANICQAEACGCFADLEALHNHCSPGGCIPSIGQIPVIPPDHIFTYIPLPQGQIICAPAISNTPECNERYDSNDGCGFNEPYCCNFNGLITEYENICQAEACGCFADLTALHEHCSPGICVPCPNELVQPPLLPTPPDEICVAVGSNTDECEYRYDSNDGCGFSGPFCCTINGFIHEYEDICQVEACGCLSEISDVYQHCTPGICVPPCPECNVRDCTPPPVDPPVIRIPEPLLCNEIVVTSAECNALIDANNCKLDSNEVVCNDILFPSLCAAMLCGCIEDINSCQMVEKPCIKETTDTPFIIEPTEDCNERCSSLETYPICCRIEGKLIEFENECERDCVFPNELDCYPGSCLNSWGNKCGELCEFVCNDFYFPICFYGFEFFQNLCMAECQCRDLSRCQSGICGNNNGNPFFENILYYEYYYGYLGSSNDYNSKYGQNYGGYK